jgi:hypothetical protein
VAGAGFEDHETRCVSRSTRGARDSTLEAEEEAMQTMSDVRADGRGDRVREHTSPIVNERIDALARHRVDECIQQGRDAIVRRLAELDQEWDIDRALMANFAIVGAASFATGMSRYVNKPLLAPRRKGFLYLFGAQLGFMLLHATVGWCPPVVLFRRLGFRTAREIAAERNALRSALESMRSDGGL